MNDASRNDILGLIDYMEDGDIFDDAEAREWHTRCIAWITNKLEQETTND